MPGVNLTEYFDNVSGKKVFNQYNLLLAQIGYWKMRPIQVQTLIYADDIILIAENEEKLQRCMIEWGEELERKGMEINTKKSKVMCISKEPGQEISIKHKNEK